MLKFYLAVMLLGSFGCAARMCISEFFAQRFSPLFPIGTLVVNVLGCFIIGAFAGITRLDGGLMVAPVVRQAVMVGFLGGLTTFSSFALQTLALISDREWGYASLNIVLSVVLCLLAVWVGQMLGVVLVRG